MERERSRRLPRRSPAAISSSPPRPPPAVSLIGIGAAPHPAQAATVVAQPWNDDNAYAANEIDAWIAIDPDDSILIRYQRSEMGQGSMTALPMIITEELQCDWSKVRDRICLAQPQHPRKQGLWRHVLERQPFGAGVAEDVQQVGASARERLIAAAAAQWNVPASECTAANSVVTPRRVRPHAALRRAGADAAAQIKLAAEPAIKTPDQFTFIGKPMPRIDVVHKINGSAKFGIDAQVPGMVFAAINACPVPGGKLKSVDDSVLAGAPGILQVVRLERRGGGGRDRQLLACQAGAVAAAA